jgi:hypothetical protein
VNNRTAIILSIVAAAVMTAALGRARYASADEEEEKPITSSSAQVSRDTAGNVVVTIQPAAQKEIGLVTQTLKPVARPVEVEAYGFVLDPAPLSKLNSDLIGAQAALDASKAQYLRSSRLYAEQKNVSLRDVQTAQAAYLSDGARLDALEQQLRDTWGSEIARMRSRARSVLVRSLVDRREAIVRVTAPAGAALDGLPDTADVVVLGHEGNPLAARTVYYAPTVEPTMQGQSFLLLVSTNEFPVRPGTAVSAYLPTSRRAEEGVMVPRSAVVRYAGKEWVYHELDGNRFVRGEVVPAQSTGDGYFVTQNLRPGERVVVAGAQALLSEELKAQIRPAD